MATADVPAGAAASVIYALAKPAPSVFILRAWDEDANLEYALRESLAAHGIDVIPTRVKYAEAPFVIWLDDNFRRATHVR